MVSALTPAASGANDPYQQPEAAQHTPSNIKAGQLRIPELNTSGGHTDHDMNAKQLRDSMQEPQQDDDEDALLPRICKGGAGTMVHADANSRAHCCQQCCSCEAQCAWLCRVTQC